jgi:hypothetical protein
MADIVSSESSVKKSAYELCASKFILLGCDIIYYHPLQRCKAITNAHLYVLCKLKTSA